MMGGGYMEFQKLPKYEEVESFLLQHWSDRFANYEQVMELFLKRYPRYPQTYAWLIGRYIYFIKAISAKEYPDYGLELDCKVKSILYPFYYNIQFYCDTYSRRESIQLALPLTDRTPKFFFECLNDGLHWYNSPYRVYCWRERFYLHYDEWTLCRNREKPYTMKSLYNYVRLKQILKKHNIEMPCYESVWTYDLRGMIIYSCLYGKIAGNQLEDTFLRLHEGFAGIPLRTCIELAGISSRLIG